MYHKKGNYFGSFWRLASSALVFLASPVRGDVIYETEDPFGGIFGLWGYDVRIQQSVVSLLKTSSGAKTAVSGVPACN